MRLATPPAVKIAQSYVVDPVTGCHVWTAANNGPAGYGVLSINGRKEYAHRISYEMHVGPIPAGFVIDHLCRNTACVNPAHLEAVTVTENRRRCINVQRTECRHGHAMTPENTVIINKRRRCRQCGRDASKALYDRKKSKAEELGVVLAGRDAAGDNPVAAAA